LEKTTVPNQSGVERFVAMLVAATGKVEEAYFQVQTASKDGSKTVYRERVYCYELYHQLRKLLQGEPGPYTLMGELDKKGHEIIGGDPVPDFVFHKPSKMGYNLVVMEVKHIANNETSEILKDCEKLRRFVEEGQYKGAIYLVFGNDGGQINRFRQIATEKLSGLSNASFVLLWHGRVHHCAMKVLCL